MTYKTLNDFDFNGKTVFVRADLNVPSKEGKITDMTRIDRFVPTLKELVEKGAKVVVASHFGRPKGEKNPEYSMAFIAEALAKASGLNVLFSEDCIGDKRDMLIRGMQSGDVVFFLRQHFRQSFLTIGSSILFCIIQLHQKHGVILDIHIRIESFDLQRRPAFRRK